MAHPEQVIIKRPVQMSDDGVRTKVALKSAATRELRRRGASPLRQHLILAMQGRGTMLTKAIYGAVKEICDARDRPLPSNWHSDIRQILQAQCASRPQYKGGADIFIYHKKGHWSCTAKSTSI
jgi:hypothetical protein